MPFPGQGDRSSSSSSSSSSHSHRKLDHHNPTTRKGRKQSIAEMPSCFFYVFFFLLLLSSPALAQQFYYTSSSTTEDCKNSHPENAGYLCTSAQQAPCETLAYFRVQGSSSFNTLAAIGQYLFNVSEAAIRDASSLNSSQIYAQQGIYIPITCSCYGEHSSYNVTYTIRAGDTFYKLSNTTYEGLTTCQAVQDANPTAVPNNLQVGQQVIFPIRCACPSAEEASQGFTTLVTYPVADGDNVSGIVSRFGVETGAFVSLNNLSGAAAPLFPATTVLLPFTQKPTVPPNATASSSSASSPPPSSSSNHGIYIAIAIVALVVVISALLLALFLLRRRRQRRISNKEKAPLSVPMIPSSPSPHAQSIKPHLGIKPKPDGPPSDFLDLMNSGDKIITYTLNDMKAATRDFHPSTLIKGSVYRGVIKGNVVAIKRVTRNIAKELEILRRVHHVNLVTLLGTCIASPEQSYLVYEYAVNGSLSDCLHGGGGDTSVGSNSQSKSSLRWATRLQVALDVATALEYIHDHTNPSYVHKGIKSSNILLDAKFRGKVANFGLAKSTSDMAEDQVTRHIVGTQGYMAPEYVSLGVVSPKIDIFALGVILLELLSGKEPILDDGAGKDMFLYQAIGFLLNEEENSNPKERLRGWMDPRLQNAYPLDCAYSVACLARSCVAEDPKARPNAREVGHTLGKLLDIAIEWEPSSVSNYQADRLEGR